jgi:outer membrane receptor protein involved in Fe transport
MLASYLLTYQEQSAPDQPVEVFAGNADGFGGLPKVRGTWEVKYSNGPFTVGLQERVVGALLRSVMLTSVYLDKKIPAIFYTDLPATYDTVVNGLRMQLFGHVNNLFDKQPPLVASPNGPTGQYATLGTLYDVIGENFTIGVRFRF